MDKKTIITALLTLVVMTGQAQAFTPIVEDSIDFVITGTTAIEDDSITWWPCAPWGRDHLVPVENGKFRVAGRLPRHTFIQIEDLHFIIEETPAHINLETCKATGGDVQRRFLQIQKEEQEIEKAMWGDLTEDEQMRVMQMCGGEEPMTTAKDSMWVRRYNAAWDSIYALRAQRYRENLDNCLPAYYLYVNHMHIPLEEFEVYMHEDAPYAHHPAMSHVWKQYWGLQEKRKIADSTFRDFEAETSDRVLHHLSEYAGRGEYVLLDFWASWCGPCRRHSIAMIPVYERYKDKGFTVVAIARERNREAMENAAKKDGYPWPSLLELNDENQVWRKNGTDNAGGAMYLIDRDGTILSTSTDAEELEPLIKKALNIE